MAETLSLISNILAVSELAVKTSILSYDYISSVQRAPQSFKELVNEIHSLLQVLISLEEYTRAKSIYSTALGKLSSLSSPLQTCSRELQELQLQLKPPNKGFKGTMSLLAWPIKEGDILKRIERIERCKTLFIFAMSVDQMSISKEIEGVVQSTNPVLQTESTAQSTWRQNDEISLHKEDAHLRAELRSKVLDWLYRDDSYAKHNEISNLRQRNTGGWVLKMPQFQDWAKGKPKSRLLWGHGIPGAGKTFLSSLIIDHLQGPQSTGYGIAHVYFNYKEQENLTVEIENLYKKLEPKRKTSTLEELYGALLVISKQFSQVFLVFDALDECHPENQRKTLLPLFKRMGKDGINVFLTSRPHPEDIRDSLNNAAKMELLAQEEDIANYIQDKIDENPRAKSLVRQGACKDRIISESVQCAKGMFLLVRFHIEFLCQQTSANKILKALDQVKSLSTVKAKRTLTVEELRVALAVKLKRYELDELDLPNRATMVDVCASLVIIDDQSDTIRLAHYTVQEYLLRSTIIPADTDFKLAMICTTYLSFNTFSEGYCKTQVSMTERLVSNPFLDYAANHIGAHLQECTEDLSTDILRLLTNPGNLSSYLQVCYQEKTWMREYWHNYGTTHSLKPELLLQLQIASGLGHFTVVQLLLEEGADVLATDYSKATALQEAASGGNEAVVRLLLEKGADVSTKNRFGDTALHMATSKGHEAVVRLLLEKGADVSAKDGFRTTALHRAASEGHEAVVKLLLEKGADVSIQNRSRYTEFTRQHLEGMKQCTALHKAEFEGHEAVVKLLLEKGADVSIKSRFGYTVLHEAASRGHEAVVKLLLEKGADPSIQSHSGVTALQKAVSQGHTIVVELLQ